MPFLIEYSHLDEFISPSQPITSICIDESRWNDKVSIELRQQPSIQSQFIPYSVPLEWFIQSSQTTFQLLMTSFERIATSSIMLIQSFPYLWITAKIDERQQLFELIESIRYEVRLEYERDQETEVFCTEVNDLVVYPKFVDPQKLERLFQSDPFSRPSIFDDTKFKPVSRSSIFELDDEEPIVVKIVNPFLKA